MSFGQLSMNAGLGSGSYSVAQPPAPELNMSMQPYSAIDAFDSLTIPYTSSTGNILVRIAGKNNGAAQPVVTCSWNGTAMTAGPVSSVEGDGDYLAACFAVAGGATGENDIVIVCTAGSAGRGFVRISSFAAMSDPPFGQMAVDNASGMLIEASLNGLSPNSDVTGIICADPDCFPFKSTEFATQGQFQGTDSAAYFGQTSNTGLSIYGAFFNANAVGSSALAIAELKGVR